MHVGAERRDSRDNVDRRGTCNAKGVNRGSRKKINTNSQYVTYPEIVARYHCLRVGSKTPSQTRAALAATPDVPQNVIMCPDHAAETGYLSMELIGFL